MEPSETELKLKDAILSVWMARTYIIIFSLIGLILVSVFMFTSKQEVYFETKLKVPFVEGEGSEGDMQQTVDLLKQLSQDYLLTAKAKLDQINANAKSAELRSDLPVIAHEGSAKEELTLPDRISLIARNIEFKYQTGLYKSFMIFSAQLDQKVEKAEYMEYVKVMLSTYKFWRDEQNSNHLTKYIKRYQSNMIPLKDVHDQLHQKLLESNRSKFDDSKVIDPKQFNQPSRYYREKLAMYAVDLQRHKLINAKEAEQLIMNGIQQNVAIESSSELLGMIRPTEKIMGFSWDLVEFDLLNAEVSAHRPIWNLIGGTFTFGVLGWLMFMLTRSRGIRSPRDS